MKHLLFRLLVGLLILTGCIQEEFINSNSSKPNLEALYGEWRLTSETLEIILNRFSDLSLSKQQHCSLFLNKDFTARAYNFPLETRNGKIELRDFQCKWRITKQGQQFWSIILVVDQVGIPFWMLRKDGVLQLRMPIDSPYTGITLVRVSQNRK